jgi:1-acyl-sn-glycerol-3-phosphate acyltransferase
VDDRPRAPDFGFVERGFVPALGVLARYHRFSVAGLEHVPRSGPGLVAVTHSAATYESFLLFREVYRATGRWIRGLGASVWLDVPGLGQAFQRIGYANATPENARSILDEGELIGVAPGGMREALRPADERFQLRWQGRTGFVRLALATGAPIVLAACPAADLIFTVYRSRLSEWGYRRFKLPLFVMRGLGPSLLPRPVQLRFHLAPPLVVPRLADPSPQVIEEWHREATRRMRDLIATAAHLDGLDDAGVDR